MDKDRTIELIKYLYDLAFSYYSPTDDGHFELPDWQSESGFIQEVLVVCGEILEQWEKEQDDVEI